MKRELKFRAWDKNTQQMIYDGICIKANGDTFQMYEYWSENGVNGTNHIIEQFTGLKDKNGVDIYEGDIIKLHTGKIETDKTQLKVCFGMGSFSLTRLKDGIDGFVSGKIPMCMINHSLEEHGIFDREAEDILEVIGNIHENPELINSKP